MKNVIVWNTNKFTHFKTIMQICMNNLLSFKLKKNNNLDQRGFFQRWVAQHLTDVESFICVERLKAKWQEGVCGFMLRGECLYYHTGHLVVPGSSTLDSGIWTQFPFWLRATEAFAFRMMLACHWGELITWGKSTFYVGR